jgi:3-isopropylmalate dehydrogenase
MNKQVLDQETGSVRRTEPRNTTLMDVVTDGDPVTSHRNTTPLIGVLPGEGIGPDVIEAALQILSAVESVSDIQATIKTSGPIGIEAENACGKALSDQVIDFCDEIFAGQGAILAGPGGGRFVYDLRTQFDLYCKFSPLKPHRQLKDSGRLKSQFMDSVDIMIVRDNIAGVYQGDCEVATSPTEGKQLTHRFSYSESQVRRLILAGARLATTRTGKIVVVVKNSGLPQISKLWSDVAAQVSEELSVQYTLVDADHCAYQLIQHPQEFDVLIAANLLGDILADLGAVLLGSRGLSFSGNFSSQGYAVYQTNHGSAYDLLGQDRANPVAQIFALAMMLRQNFNLADEASLIEQAVADVWSQGWRTDDLAMPDHRVVGTREITALIADAITNRSDQSGVLI